MDENGYGYGSGAYKRIRSESYQPVSLNHYHSVASFDQSSSALLIDRMFNHLAKETEVMREWITLEKERFNRDALRRKEEAEREERREKSFLETLMKMQEQTFAFLAKQNLTPGKWPSSLVESLKSSASTQNAISTLEEETA